MDHCEQMKQPGGCQLHNLQCGYPECNEPASRDAYVEPDFGVTTPIDTAAERKGEWMHTSLGGKFWPADPRPEEIKISDIGNGLALDCRYAGQGRVDRYYSVAEHCFHLAAYALNERDDPWIALAALLHDSAEAYINDLNRATKHAVDSVASKVIGTDNGIGNGVIHVLPADAYSAIEKPLAEAILHKYQVWDTFNRSKPYIKDLDCRIVPLEKAAVMRYPQPWAFDTLTPLEGVTIRCWSPESAKINYLTMYTRLAAATGQTPEHWEI